MPRTVEFFFDPVCPFCWQTSKWFRQVARLDGDIQPVWRFICLAILNEEEDDGASSAGHLVGRKLLRVAAAIRRDHGQDAVGRYYEEVGSRLWETPLDVEAAGEAARWKAVETHQQSVVDELGDVLAAADLPRELASAADDDSFDAELRASTDEAMERTGGDVGTPILSFDPPDGPAFFGPVISTTPSDEQAVQLWQAVTTLAQWPSFAEIKRSLRDPIDNATLRSIVS